MGPSQITKVYDCENSPSNEQPNGTDPEEGNSRTENLHGWNGG